MKALCIYNPNAGGGKAGKQLQYIKQLLIKYQIDTDFLITKYAHHGTELVQNADLSVYDVLIVTGGDGSFFDVLNAYMNQTIKIPVGIIPVGTGNSLSKDISLKADNPEDFVKIIARKKTVFFDVGKLETGNATYYFANMAGFGFTTDVTLTGIKYKFLGAFAYTLGVLLNVIKLKSYPLQLILNGKTYEIENTYVTISNSKYAGGKMLLAPKAKVDDALLDVVLVNKVGRLRLLKTFSKIFNGSYIASPFVDYYQVKEVEFRSSHHKVVSPDGEILGSLPLKVSVVHRAVEMIVDNSK